MMLRSAVVTGITGQDGGYLAEQLAGEGATVHGVLRPGEPVPPHLTALGHALVLCELELDDEQGLGELLAGTEPDCVINLAGMSSVAQSWAEPVMTAEVNGVFVARLLEQCWQHQQRTRQELRVVQASTAEIFAGTTVSPQDETTPLSTRSPYGASKAFAHHLVQVFRARGLHASNAILYNHESPRRPRTFVTRKITSTVAAIARGEASSLILGNLDVQRDWGWAPDYVDAMLRAARAETPDDYVIATGQAHSVREFVAAAMARAGIEDWERLVRVDEAFLRPSDATVLVGDASRARERLGWAPTVPFEEVVGRLVEHDLSAATAPTGT